MSYFPSGGGGSGIVETVGAGTRITVDSTDPANPIVNADLQTNGFVPNAGNSASGQFTLTRTVATNLISQRVNFYGPNGNVNVEIMDDLHAIVMAADTVEFPEGAVFRDYNTVSTNIQGKIAYDEIAQIPVYYNGAQWCTFDGTPV